MANSFPKTDRSAQPAPWPALALVQGDAQRLARLTGFLFIATFATSIPPVIWFYAAALGEPAFVLAGGSDPGVFIGALLELLLILANICTALALFPILRRQSEALSLGFVAARLVECGFIAVGVVALLALNTLRMQGDGMDPQALGATAAALVAVHDWTFRLGPGVVVGVGNGLVLGYLMWTTRLVPRFLSILGLVGGPSLLVAGGAVLFGWIDAASAPQAIATIPEFFWELFLGLWLLVRGVDSAALERLGFRP